jgi:hypothetical protein
MPARSSTCLRQSSPRCESARAATPLVALVALAAREVVAPGLAGAPGGRCGAGAAPRHSRDAPGHLANRRPRRRLLGQAVSSRVVADRAIVSGTNTALDLRTGKTVTLGSARAAARSSSPAQRQARARSSPSTGRVGRTRGPTASPFVASPDGPVVTELVQGRQCVVSAYTGTDALWARSHDDCPETPPGLAVEGGAVTLTWPTSAERLDLANGTTRPAPPPRLRRPAPGPAPRSAPAADCSSSGTVRLPSSRGRPCTATPSAGESVSPSSSCATPPPVRLLARSSRTNVEAPPPRGRRGRGSRRGPVHPVHAD